MAGCRIERLDLRAARLTGHRAKLLQQGDGALIGTVRAVAKELDVFVRPSQGLRIVGAAIERNGYGVGDVAPGAPA